jgi:hypothetical protein
MSPSESPPRYFRLAEANQQIRRLTPLLERLLELRAHIRRLGPAGRRPAADQDTDQHALRALVEAASDTTEEIAALGCVIKDVELGLVDWPAWHDGRAVWLCWRLGEPEVGFWHDLDAGFAGRRPVAELARPLDADPTP